MTTAPTVWKVIHAKDGVETVYLVAASSSREAETLVLDNLYDDRNYFVAEDPDRLANDGPFGLLAASQHRTRTNRALCKLHGCSVSTVLFAPDPPYRLYAIDTKTGAVS